MHFPLVPSLLVILLSTSLRVQAQKTYYIDVSCTNRNEWQGAWDSAMRNARSVSTRLSSNTDKDFERVVLKTFKVDRSDNRFTKIKEPFDDILSWTAVPRKATNFDTLKSADVRIFCDNDAIKANRDASDVNGPARWRKLVSIQGQERHMDDKNYMMFYGKPWCQMSSNEGAYRGHADFGRMTTARPTKHDGTPNLQYGQNERRVTITLCDYTFTERYEFGNFDEIIRTEDMLDWNNKDWDRSDIENFESMIAHTILHELIHASRPDVQIKNPNNPTEWIWDPQNGGIGDYPDLQNAYSWHSIVKMDYDTAIKNADSYAELGLLAMFADRGYTLPRAVPNMELNEEDRAQEVQSEEDGATDGYIWKYSDITRRALRTFARWFVA